MEERLHGLSANIPLRSQPIFEKRDVIHNNSLAINLKLMEKKVFNCIPDSIHNLSETIEMNVLSREFVEVLRLLESVVAAPPIFP